MSTMKKNRKPSYEDDKIRAWPKGQEPEPEGEEVLIHGERVLLVGFEKFQDGNDVLYLKHKPDVILYIAQSDGARMALDYIRSNYHIPFQNGEDAINHIIETKKRLGDNPVEKSKWK